jgi:glycosyltransferase involved in cell wall biosynthesis
MSTALHVLLVGPLPPPAGGMANQTRQLARLLESEGMRVSLVQTNAPYRPQWVERLRGLRALFRLLPYLQHLSSAAKEADVVHVMANSGWSWHLFAAPAIWIARLRGKPVVVNYRGGLAADFLGRQARIARATLAGASAMIVPSGFLKAVFARHRIAAEVIPNVVDVLRFRPAKTEAMRDPVAPHIVVARNLEHLYGNDVAIRALTILRQRHAKAWLTLAGSGPEAEPLRRLTEELGIANAVRFAGRLDPAEMADLYRSADVVLNPSRADNTPNSVLESLACGVPVVSTDVGGLPFLVEHGRTALLVPPDAPELAADAIARVLGDVELRHRLVMNGLDLARNCSWSVVRTQWLELYRGLASGRMLRGRITAAMR